MAFDDELYTEWVRSRSPYLWEDFKRRRLAAAAQEAKQKQEDQRQLEWKRQREREAAKHKREQEQKQEREWQAAYARRKQEWEQRLLEVARIEKQATREILAERAQGPKKLRLGCDEIYQSAEDDYPAIDLIQLRHARMGPEADPEDANPYQEAARRLCDISAA